MVTICELLVAIPCSDHDWRQGLALNLLRRRDRILGGRRCHRLGREGCEAVGDGNDKPVDLKDDRFVVTDREAAEARGPIAVSGIEFASRRLTCDDEEIGTHHLIAHHATGGLHRDAAVVERLQGCIRRCRAGIERHPIVRALPTAATAWIHTLLRKDLRRNADPYPGLWVVDKRKSGRTSSSLGGGKQGGADLRRQHPIRWLLHPRLEGRYGRKGLAPEVPVRDAAVISSPDQGVLNRTPIRFGQSLEGASRGIDGSVGGARLPPDRLGNGGQEGAEHERGQHQGSGAGMVHRRNLRNRIIFPNSVALR